MQKPYSKPPPPQDNRLLKSDRIIGYDLRFDFLGTIQVKENGNQTSKFISILIKKHPPMKIKQELNGYVKILCVLFYHLYRYKVGLILSTYRDQKAFTNLIVTDSRIYTNDIVCK